MFIGILASSGSGGGTPTDAQAFIDATGITDPTQQGAIEDLVDDLVAQSLWDKMYAVYPFVGGTATTHKYNLINPLDTDAAFRIIWNGTITHDANGVTGDGNTGSYGDTNFDSHADFTSATDSSLGLYIRSNILENEVDMGVGVKLNLGENVTAIYSRYSNNFYAGSCSTAIDAVANTDSRGLFVATRNNGTQYSQHIRGSSTVNQTNADVTGADPSGNIWVCGGFAPGQVDFNCTKNQAFAFIGKGLSEADVDALYTLVQAYQTTLSRQV